MMMLGLIGRGCRQSTPRIAALRQGYATTSPQSARIRKILKRQVVDPPQNLRPCVSASKCEHYDLAKAVTALTGNGVWCRILEQGEFAHAKYGPERSDVLILENGTVVGWNVSEKAIVGKLLPLIASAEQNPFTDVETEDMDYVEQETNEVRSGMIGDVIYIHGPTEETRLMDKIAFSSGMARHTKLSALELRTNKLVDQIKVISSHMAAGQQPNLSQSDAVQLTGKLLQLRGNLNLYSELTETPDIYWSQPEQESLYDLISGKLDVEPRIEILNSKLDYASEMISILRNHLSEKTSLRLEWMIIWLILIEVMIEVRRLVFED